MNARTRLPNRREHETFRLERDGLMFTAGLGCFPDGRRRPAEAFIATDKLGNLFDTVVPDSTIMPSFALQRGANAETIRRELLRNGDGSTAGLPLGALVDLIERAPADHETAP
jgi:hypothetical protein